MRAATILSLAALASAVPTTTKHQSPSSKSKGFTLVAKVSNPNHDLSPSINNRVIIAAHTGAGFNVAVLYPAGSNGSIFYQNGTAAEVAAGTTTLINDEATPLTPFGLSIQSPAQFDTTYPTEHAIFINAGRGTRVTLVNGNRGYPIVHNGLDTSTDKGQGRGTFAACDNTVPYYQKKFVTLMYVYGGEKVPEGCAPVVLVPQCAVLAALPEGSYASHEFANEVGCFGDVAREVVVVV